MEEPSFVLRAALFHFAGGDAWFVGLGLLLIGLMVEGLNRCFPPLRSVLLQVPSLHRWGVLLGAMAYLWAMLAAAIPAVWCAGLGLWLLLDRYVIATGGLQRGVSQILRVTTCLVLVGFLIHEARYAIFWRPSLPSQPVIGVIGDSVTAGLNENDQTWPRRLAGEAPWSIYDASQQGATVESALRQLERLPKTVNLLLIEIGGNDMLEGLPVDRYQPRLAQLLKQAQQPGRTIILWELPLPPFQSRYGAAQRDVAQQFGVTFLPRRNFARILTESGNTVDGIHLSNQGQARMAALVQQKLGWHHSSERRTKSNYHRLEQQSGSSQGTLAAPRSLDKER